MVTDLCAEGSGGKVVAPQNRYSHQSNLFCLVLKRLASPLPLLDCRNDYAYLFSNTMLFAPPARVKLRLFLFSFFQLCCLSLSDGYGGYVRTYDTTDQKRARGRGRGR